MFSIKERNIYGPYNNGKKEVYGDPLKIYRILLKELDGDPNRYYENTLSPDPIIYSTAIEKISLAVQKAFDVLPFSEENPKGLTEEESLALVNNFNDWFNKKKMST